MARAPARIVLTNSFSDDYTGGVAKFEIDAKTLRDVIKALDERYPGVGERLEEETTVAIDGELYEVDYSQPVRPGCEIFFIPKIDGG
jgi:sulfur-carrier protein